MNSMTPPRRLPTNYEFHTPAFRVVPPLFQLSPTVDLSTKLVDERKPEVGVEVVEVFERGLLPRKLVFAKLGEENRVRDPNFAAKKLKYELGKL